MIYSDLHCDTVTRCFAMRENFTRASGHINSFKIKQFEKYRQCFALFVDDSKRGSAAFSYFKKLIEFYERKFECVKADNFKPVLTVENGALLGGDSNNIHLMADKGVRMLTLTWNGENELAFGADCEKGGLKPFGKDVITLMEKRGVLIDVSHLNDESFCDVASFTSSPLIASHSNCRSLNGHRRNLTDEQLKLIIESKGLIGLCFHSPFLLSENNGSFEMLWRNIYHILSLGGEDNICFGSDFDGGTPEECLDSLEKVTGLYDYLYKRGLDSNLLKKLFYFNADKIL